MHHAAIPRQLCARLTGKTFRSQYVKPGQYKTSPVSCLSAENIIHPPADFIVTDFPEISLGRGKIGMPENHLAYDFNRRLSLACISCRMSPKSMGTELDTYKPVSLSAQPGYHHAGKA